VYEVLRLVFLVGAYTIMQPGGAFPWLAAITPGALFLLMALFWRINLARYRLYCPLYIAGKGLSVIITVLWLFFAQNDMIRGLLFDGSVLIIIPGIALFFLLGDMLSAWFVAKMMRNSERRM
jgi:hypothetical protein